VKKPLALLLVPAAVAVLAIPAGASSAATWTHQSIHCATGHKSATVVLKWVPNGQTADGGEPDTSVQKGWYDNPCPSQWLKLGWCAPDSQSDCYALEVAPHHKGRLDVGAYATLLNGPSCEDGTVSATYVPARKAPSCPDN
jgi:hypothetical protein